MTRLSTERNSGTITRPIVRGALSGRSAGVALIFALTIIPIIGTLGLAIDLSIATQSKWRLDAAADAAALAAVRTAADAFAAGTHDYIILGREAGSQWFTSQSVAIAYSSVQTPTVEVTQSGSILSASVTYVGDVSTPFANMFGIKMIALRGSSSATIATTAYVSITFLVDNSSSMLIAATDSGVDLMHALTPSQAKVLSVPNGLSNVPCAFACHWDRDGRDYYGVARDNKILLRLDVVQLAVQTAIGEMISAELFAHQFAVAIYTFGEVLTRIYPRDAYQPTSTDLTGAVAATQAIQTPVVSYQANTNFPAVMASLADRSTAAGNGSSPANPRKALIVVTDGLTDYGSRTIPSNRGPIDPVNCATMKQLGFEVFLLYTTYLTTLPNLLLPGDNADLLPFIRGTTAPALVTALKSCASSPNDFSQASDPDGISAAMKKMLQAALSSAGRFTE